MIGKIRSLIKPPSVTKQGETADFNIRFLHYSLIFGFAVSMLGFISQVISQPASVLDTVLLLFVPLFLLIGISFFLVQRGYFYLPAHMISWGLFAIFLTSSLVSTGVTATGFFALVAVVLFSGLLLGFRVGLVFTILGAMAGLLMVFFKPLPVTETERFLEPSYFYLIMQVSLSLFALMVPYWVEQRNRRQIETIRAKTSELAQSQALYRAFYLNAPVGIVRTDVNGRILNANQQAAEIFGFADAEQVIASGAELLYADIQNREELQRQLEQVNFVENFETQGKRLDGQVIWVQLSSRKLLNEQDGSVYFETSIQDITGRKQVEARLRFHSEFERFVSSISTSFLSVTGKDFQAEIGNALSRLGAFLEVDRCYLWQLESVEQANLIHQWSAKGIAPAFKSGAKATLRSSPYAMQRMNAGMVFSVSDIQSLANTAPELIPVYSEISVQSVLNVPFGFQERTLGWIGVHMVKGRRNWQEETIRLLKVVGEIIASAIQRQQYEKELQVTQALLQTAIDHSPAGILVADAPDVMIRIANRSALGIRGTTTLPLKDIPYELHPENWQCFYLDGRPYKGEDLPLSRAILHGETIENEEVIIRRPDGEERVVLANAAPVRDSDGRIVAGIVVFPDITERVHAMEQVERSEAYYRGVVEDQTELIVRWKPDGRRTFVNEAYCRYYARSSQELLGTPIFDMADEESIAFIEKNLASITPQAPTWTGANLGKMPDGSRRWREWTNRGIFDGEGRLVEIQSVGRDIHEQHLAQAELRQRLEIERLVASISAHMVNVQLEDFEREINTALESISNWLGVDRTVLWHFSEQTALLSKIYEWTRQQDVANHRAIRVNLNEHPWLLERILENKPIQIPSVGAMPAEAQSVRAVFQRRGMQAVLMLPVAPAGKTVGSISFQYRREHQGWSQGEMRLLQIFAEVLLNTVERIRIEHDLRESEERYRKVIETSPDAIALTDLAGQVEFCNPQFAETYGYEHAGEVIGKTALDLVAPESLMDVLQAIQDRLVREELNSKEYVFLRKDGSRFIGEIRTSVVLDSRGEPQALLVVGRDITERKQAESALRSSEMRFQAFMDTLPALVFYKDEQGRYLYANSAYEDLYGFEEQEWKNKTDFDLWPDRAGRIRKTDERILHTGMLMKFEGISERVSKDRIWQIYKFPFTDADGKNFLGSIALDISEQRKAEEKIARQLHNLQALHTIDQAIAANTEIESTLRILLIQVQTQLGIDAADILLYEEPTQTLMHADSTGFQRPNLQNDVFLRVGSGCAGRVVLERKTIYIPDIRSGHTCVEYIPTNWIDEGFISYFGVPLIAKGAVKGVLELYHRSAFEPNADWFSFLELLAGQAAIAIDNATLFKDLQRSNMEMALAYDTTLEGWARALELRDQETEGHSRRVTHLTLQLARAMGMGQEELVHVRRGALLHDIGKMGIPDSILRKPGPLDEAEWEVMRQHPVMAYRLLSSIPYLRRALDIPYGHHERWDGSGYPQGLRQYEIPLAARIFAVVDVWDALLSDRPYRDAWPEEKVMAYLEEQAGKQLDPQVVEVFFRILREQSSRS